MKPFIKWAGGKSRLINTHLKYYLPKTFTHYHEPFVGGGAMLAYLKPDSFVINDINLKLINVYETIINGSSADYEAFLYHLGQFRKNHSELQYNNVKSFFNDIDSGFSQPVLAAAFIYLNKTCFNGLYRVNSKGEFNVSMDRSKKEFVVDWLNFHEWRDDWLTVNSIILGYDFRYFFENVTFLENDFVFVDPPYDSEDGKTFTSYDSNKFGTEEQVLLSEYLKDLHSKKVQWMHTNNDTPLIRELYKDFTIIPVTTNRSISSKGSTRKNSGKEVIIINYNEFRKET